MRVYENLENWPTEFLIEEMEKAISDGYTKEDHVYLFFEYVPEALWNEIRRRLLS